MQELFVDLHRLFLCCLLRFHFGAQCLDVALHRLHLLSQVLHRILKLHSICLPVSVLAEVLDLFQVQLRDASDC